MAAPQAQVPHAHLTCCLISQGSSGFLTPGMIDLGASWAFSFPSAQLCWNSWEQFPYNFLAEFCFSVIYTCESVKPRQRFMWTDIIYEKEENRNWHYLETIHTVQFLHILMLIKFGACLKYWFCSHHSYTLVLMKRTMKGIPTDGTDAVYSHTSQFFQVSEIKNRHKRPALSIENGDSLKTQR